MKFNENPLFPLNAKNDEAEIYENWAHSAEEFISDPVAYQNWFDHCSSLHGAASMGFVDMFSRILTPEMYPIIGNPSDKVSMEIGFGGGRLMNAAAHAFRKAIGIDIMSEKCFDATAKFINDQRTYNYELYHYNDIGRIPDKSVDFVYSFIVFQHFGEIKYFYDYVNLIKRVLTDTGCCRLFLSKNLLNDEDFFIRNTLGECKSNCTAYYKPEFVARTLEDSGFKVLSMNINLPKNPWTTNKLSAQFAVTFCRELPQ
jgi:ubiquinone/menaquinone biosynthesis C-methylase UbiE